MTQYGSQRAVCEDLDPRRLVDVNVVQRDEQHSHFLFRAGPGRKMLGAQEEKKGIKRYPKSNERFTRMQSCISKK